MKAKLVKRSNDRFDLYSIEDKNQINTIASSFDNPIGKLSLKNCQAIECGYDLDELAHHNSLSYTWLEFNERDKTLISKYGIEAFKAGFQKALELLGDKKFSEDDMKAAYGKGFSKQGIKSFNLLIQSLQQTEWDVEIEMENYEPLYDMGSTPRPKLDADGCLILKTFKSE